MPNRLLSFLTEIERAMIANDPSPDGGTWDTLRLVNFHQGLARLTLAVRTEHITVPRGSILLQNFTLADGSHSLKAHLSWQGKVEPAIYAIYAKPHINWNLEASQIAIKWLDGQAALAEAGHEHHEETHAAGSLVEAVG